eukprot:TRINITY_DN5687_c0_g1_i1.p1 TRINITY_DN5687_c0_g1~~TRINITY_DN5687_c0_g1_i1.p1  ORF type:complete len:615 (-),score=140.67 TRINITY_DN5687_c0_g1_i1:461-2305(-)
MDEVDEIILHSLRSAGCDIGEDVKSLKQFGPNDVVAAALACLRTVDTSRTWPKTVPRHTSQKVTFCSEMARTIKEELGYREELGYHQLLYPSESDTRKILRFLVDQLPEADGASFIEETPETKMLRLIKSEMQGVMAQNHKARSYRQIYTFKATPLRSAYVPGPKSTRNAPLEKYIREHVLPLTQQAARRVDAPPSLLEYNLVVRIDEVEKEEELARVGARTPMEALKYRQNKQAAITKKMNEALRTSMVDAGKASARLGSETLQDLVASLEATGVKGRGRGKFALEVSFNRPDKPDENKKDETEEELQERRQKEIEELDNSLFSSKGDIERLEKAIADLSASIKKMEEGMDPEDAKKKELEKKYTVLKRTYDLLPEAESNIEILENLSQKAAARLASLEQEWERHKAPLMDELEELRRQQENKKGDTQLLLAEIAQLRSKFKTMGEDMRVRNERLAVLKEQFDAMPKEVNRGIYTRRILDIVKNVKKQKTEIDKILLDMKQLMKEITLVTESLKRSFAVTEEMMFADAKKDETSKQAYRELNAMDTHFKKLVATNEETGETRNAILQLSNQIDSIKERTSALNTERLEEDYKNMKKENAKLMAQLAGSGGTGL